MNVVQGTLVLMAVPEEQQGVGMGMLTLAIGAQAGGMNLLGLVAAMTSARHAMVIFSAAGVFLQVVAWLALPQCSRMTNSSHAGSEQY